MKGLFLVEILKVVFIIIGTFVGAGFASGKEIYLYFYRYGIYGLIGICISSIFIGIILYNSINLSKNKKIKNYDNFLNNIIKNKREKIVLKSIIDIFLILSFCIMITGFCSFMRQEFNIKIIISYIIMILVCINIFNKNVNTIIKINDFLIPIIIMSVVIFLFISFEKNIDFFYSNINENNNIMLYQKNKIKNNFFISSILYSNYNLLSIIPISVVVNKLIKKQILTKYICIVSTIVIVLLSVSIFLILSCADTEILTLDMPVVASASKYGVIFKYYYCIIVGMSIITTALSVGYGYLQKYEYDKKIYNKHMLILVLGTLISMPIGFSKLVENLYPIFGCVGVVQSIFIIREYRKK